MAYVLADPSSVLNFSHDWDDYLVAGETIVSRQWSISPLNNTTPETPALTGATTDTVFVEGMQAGKIYYLVERITTNTGIVDDRTIVVRCENR